MNAALITMFVHLDKVATHSVTLWGQKMHLFTVIVRTHGDYGTRLVKRLQKKNQKNKKQVLLFCEYKALYN